MTTLATDARIEKASRSLPVLWPLDRAIAVNPLLDRIDVDFVTATTELEALTGVSLWPELSQLSENHRSDLRFPSGAEERARPLTAVERVVGQAGTTAQNARRVVGDLLIAATGISSGESGLQRLLAVVADDATSLPVTASERARIGELVATSSLDELALKVGGVDDEAVVAEFTAHFFRLPGWASWAKWCDRWRRGEHAAALSRAEFLLLSLAVDNVFLERSPRTAIPAPVMPSVRRDDAGIRRLLALEGVIHGPLLERLHPATALVKAPLLQVATCIDVRSEPLRRGFERFENVETFGVAGFFGIPAATTRTGESEALDALPVLVAPTLAVSGGEAPSTVVDAAQTFAGTFAELTHEPSAMFALAEGSGWLTAPWLLARRLFGARQQQSELVGPITIGPADRVTIAAGALRAMGLTKNFAPVVLLLGHGATSRANTHAATLQCGACAARPGGMNARVLATFLNDAAVREGLATEGITIPRATTFVAGEHNTTTHEVVVAGVLSDELVALVNDAANFAANEAAEQLGVRSRAALARKATDWSDARPEWGLAGNALFVVGPRRSTRGADLEGKGFLHSYEADDDLDGSILTSILAAPVVVAQWINAAYYYSTVAPDVLGAGDKAMLNPVGDFAVIAGDDPDLRGGLPRQSLFAGDRPFHRPVRLLVAVEAPLERVERIIRDVDVVGQLVEGQWIHLAARSSVEDPWQRWQPGHGWQ